MEITLWYRWDLDKREWRFSHYEEGYSVFSKPFVKFKNSPKWLNMRWSKECARMVNNEVIYDYLL